MSEQRLYQQRLAKRAELLREAARLRKQASRLYRQASRALENQPGDAWRASGLEPPGTDAERQALHDWVRAHAPAVADRVGDEVEFADGAWPLHVAVASVLEETDCDFPCEHRTLSVEEWFRQPQVVEALQAARRKVMVTEQWWIDQQARKAADDRRAP